MKTVRLVLYSMAGGSNSLNLALSRIQEEFPGRLQILVRGRDDLENEDVLGAYLEEYLAGLGVPVDQSAGDQAKALGRTHSQNRSTGRKLGGFEA